MEMYNYKKDLSGTWRLYIAEHRNCKDYAHMIFCEKELKKKGLTAIDGTVPGNFELDMEKAGLIGDLFYDVNTLEAQKLENRHLWYVCNFEHKGATKDFMLRFEGIDTVAEVFLNGNYIDSTENMYLAHELSVSEELKSGKNELMVHIIPAMIYAREEKFGAGVTMTLPYNAAAERLRKAPSMFGWDIMPRIVSGGIWKPVYLIQKKKERINETYMYQRHDDRFDCVTCYYDIEVEGDLIQEYSLEIDGKCGDSVIYRKSKLWHTTGYVDADVKDPQLWWPRNMGEPNLYEVTVRLFHGDELLDEKTFKHGIRYVKLVRTDYIDEDGNGEFKFEVNGKPFFAMGTNWVPLDAFHSRDLERLPKALELLWDSGSNIVRCWGGNVYENQEFFDFCDEHGIAVWQDFAMGCAIYPQDEDFQAVLKHEAIEIIKKYRQHASLFLWAGDNEVDVMTFHPRNPNRNILTRRVLPEAIIEADPLREYLPSSPYVSQKVIDDGMRHRLSEDHLWGPRRYYKEDFYKNAVARFASETGYHGCPSPKSVEKFIAPENLWPWKDNDAWLVHAACMETAKERNAYSYRIALMASHLDILFGDTVPDGLENFALASQISQAEAFKYFIERFRSGKWDRTGIIWWNLLDGWPQFSDAVVDYYHNRKLAYFTISRSQTPVCVMFRDPAKSKKMELVVANETQETKTVSYKVTDIESGKIISEGEGEVSPLSTCELEKLTAVKGQALLLIEYTVDGKAFKNHYLTGEPTYDYKKVVEWYKKAGILDIEGF